VEFTNEQDNRISANSQGPVLVPSDPQEAKDFTKIAFELSESIGAPVLLRSATRVSHTRSPVTFSPLGENVRQGNRRKGTLNPTLSGS